MANITINQLVEQTTAADTDCMVIGGTDAKKIKWSTICNLIKAKLGIGTVANLRTASKELVGAVNELNSALALLSGIRSTLTNGGVEFTSRVYQAGEAYVDGTANTDRCEIMYLRIYSQSDRSLLIGTMVSTSEDDWWSKYVASGTVLVTKNIGSEWYGWVSLSSAKG